MAIFDPHSLYQIASYFFTHAQSTLAALNLELADSEGYALRPSNLANLYALIPEGIYNSVWAAAPAR